MTLEQIVKGVIQMADNKTYGPPAPEPSPLEKEAAAAVQRMAQKAEREGERASEESWPDASDIGWRSQAKKAGIELPDVPDEG